MIRKESPVWQTFHNPETLRVFVSGWPPERGCFGESCDRESRLWRVVESLEIAGKYEKSRCFALLQDTGLFE